MCSYTESYIIIEMISFLQIQVSSSLDQQVDQPSLHFFLLEGITSVKIPFDSSLLPFLHTQ